MSKCCKIYSLSLEPQLLYRDVCLSLLPHRMHCFRSFLLCVSCGAALDFGLEVLDAVEKDSSGD